MCEAGLPPPAAFCSKADLEVCAGARGLWETQVLKKTSLGLRKNPSDLKDPLPDTVIVILNVYGISPSMFSTDYADVSTRCRRTL